MADTEDQLYYPRSPAGGGRASAGGVTKAGSQAEETQTDHLPFHERIRQRIQRLMLAASRTKSIREAEEVHLIYLFEDGDHCVLDDLVLQCGDPERTLPSVAFLDVNPSRWQRPIRTAMQPTVQIGKPTLQPGFILLPCHPVHAGCSLAFQRTKAVP